MSRYVYYFLMVLMTVGCSHKDIDSPTRDVTYYRQDFDDARQTVNECQKNLKYDKSYTENHQNCKNAFYVVVFDPSMESARHSH